MFLYVFIKSNIEIERIESDFYTYRKTDKVLAFIKKQTLKIIKIMKNDFQVMIVDVFGFFFLKLPYSVMKIIFLLFWDKKKNICHQNNLQKVMNLCDCIVFVCK